jgi:hypothetical protein
MILARKLPLRFDPERLHADLARLAPDDWHPHFNTREYEGDWSGVALRAPARAAGTGVLQAGLHVGSDFEDTLILGHCPYLREVLAAFLCPVKSARLLKLGPGAIIREHRDYDLGLEQGEARVHVPVVTNPSVEFILDGRRVILGEGEAWYLDLSRPHSVRNRGATDRVHLVVDCIADGWFHSQLAAGVEHVGTSAEGEPDSGGFERFRELVLSDRWLQEICAGTSDKPSFVALLVRLGEERGFAFRSSDVEDALRAARRSWIERVVR